MEPKLSLEEANALLAGPGGPYEITRETVGGVPLQVFRNRPHDLREILARSAERGDQDLWVFDDGRRLSSAEHVRVVASVARAFQERYDIGPGDRVAILGANSAEWIVSLWATISLDAIAVGMNGWWTADEIHYGLELTEPKLLIADRRRIDRLEGADPGCPTVVMEDGFAELWNHDLDAPLPDASIDEDDPAVILFTSGTTGRPKGAIATHRNLIAFLCMMEFTQRRVAVMYGTPVDVEPPRQVSIATAPLFHVSGLQSCALGGPYSGNKYVWTSGRFDPEKIFRLTREEGITRWGGVTTQIWLLLEHPAFEQGDWSQVQSIGGGGSTFSPELQRLIRRKLPHCAHALSVGYGLTECGGLATIATDAMLREHPDCVGGVMPTVEVAILDDDDVEQPEGVDANICVRGAMVMPGYWRNPEATADAIRPGGWLKTGDIGHLRDGLLYLASRKRDMIIRGGENVYPVEIENRLEEHPGVHESAVVGVDHRTLGQEVKAIVVPVPGASPDPGQLRKFVGETLAYYKVPAYIELRDEPLPRNASGKLLKQVLTGESENRFIEE